MKWNVYCFQCISLLTSWLSLVLYIYSFSYNYKSDFSISAAFLLFSHSVTSDSLQPHEWQHAWLPYPSLTPGVRSNSSIELVMLSNHLILCRPLLLLPSIFPSIKVFSISWLFAAGGQSIRASVSVLPMSIEGWFPLGLTGLIYLLSKQLSRVFSNTRVQKQQYFSGQPSLWSTSDIRTWLLEKP